MEKKRGVGIITLLNTCWLVLLLTSCSSCSKKQEPKETIVEDYSYKDFQSVDDDDCNNATDIEPTFEKEYRVRLRVIRRTYLV